MAPDHVTEFIVADASATLDALLHVEGRDDVVPGDWRPAVRTDFTRLATPGRLPMTFEDLEGGRSLKICCRGCSRSYGIFHAVRNALLLKRYGRLRVTVNPRKKPWYRRLVRWLPWRRRCPLNPTLGAKL